MVQSKQLLAPAVLFAAGSFAGSAQAATFITDVDLTAGNHSTLAIGVPTADAQFSFTTSVKSSPIGPIFSAHLNANGDAGVFYEDQTLGGVIPSDADAFSSSVKTNMGTGYYGLRFDVGGDDYYGYAFLDTPSHISQVAYEAPSEFAVTANVPEPATWAEMLLGLGVAGAAMRRRRQQAVAANA